MSFELYHCLVNGHTHLGGDATDVQAGSTEGAAALNAGDLQAKLGSLDGSDVPTRTTSDNDDILLKIRNVVKLKPFHKARVGRSEQ